MSRVNNKKNKNNIGVFFTFTFIAVAIGVIFNGSKIFGNNLEKYLVSNGSLYYSETTEGYVLRDETVLKGEKYKNGMVQVLADGERAAKGERVFRYYSNSEDSILKKMSEIDEQINELMENSGLTIVSSDISSLEDKIEESISKLYEMNDVQKIHENKNKIETYIYKKAQMTAELSPSDSYVKVLSQERDNLEKELENSSESIYAPLSGLLSYRVDGLEEQLKVDNFDYLTSDLLSSYNLKVGAVIPLSTESGKIVNNFEDYVVAVLKSEKAMTANVGDKVTLDFSNLSDEEAEIVYIKDEEKDRIIVFKLDRGIEELLESRKITFDIIWWNYSGLKISNSAIIEENDITFVEKKVNGNTVKFPVKVLRQNDTYSIVENYEKEELQNLGYTEDEIEDFETLKLYDEILLH